MRLTLDRSTARARELRNGYDIAYIEMLVYQTDFVDLGRLRKRTPLLSHVHDVRPHTQTLPSRLEDRLLRQVYSASGHILVFHEILKQQLISEFGVSEDLIHVIPIPFDGSDLRDTSVRKPIRPMFLVFGALRPNKGVDVVVEAIRSLGAELVADVVIAGNGDRQTLEYLQGRLKSMPNVSLELGRVTEVRKRELFSQASWILLPYTSFHSQSGVLADAYAYRVPIIASNVGAVGPTVLNDGTGVVIPPGDSRSLAEAMMSSIKPTSPSLAANLDSAASAHDFAVVGPLLRGIFDQVVARREN